MYSELIVIAVALLQVQPDPPPSTGNSFSVPVGPLPWSMPSLPSVSIDLDVGTATFDEVSHTVDYADNVTVIEDWLGVSSSSETGILDEWQSWTGPGGIIPDMSDPDFDTGISVPGHEDMTSYEMASEMGTNIGMMFANIRALATLLQVDDIGGADTVIGGLLLSIAWMILVVIIKFCIQLLVALWSLVNKLIEMIPFVE